MKLLHSLPPLLLASVFLAGTTASHAEKWTTANGVVEGKLSGVYGTTVHLIGKKTRSLLPLDSLDDAGLDQVARFLGSQPDAKWKDSTSAVAKAVRGKLQVLQNGKLVAFDPGDRPEPEFYVLYFSAHWCGPCKKFTPQLAQSYIKLRDRTFGEKCEILFVSLDRDRSEHATYVAEAQMPWLVVKYNSGIDILEKWKANSIPGLAVINRNGEIVFHSHEGGEYRGPTRAFQDLLALLRNMEPDKAKYRQSRHRLAVRQQILASANQSIPGQPYYTTVDRKRYHGLPVTEILVRCAVSEKGTVDSFAIEPELPPAFGPQLKEDIGKWLFLPAANGGKALPQEIAVPVNFATPTAKPAEADD